MVQEAVGPKTSPAERSREQAARRQSRLLTRATKRHANYNRSATFVGIAPPNYNETHQYLPPIPTEMALSLELSQSSPTKSTNSL